MIRGNARVLGKAAILEPLGAGRLHGALLRGGERRRGADRNKGCQNGRQSELHEHGGVSCARHAPLRACAHLSALTASGKSAAGTATECELPHSASEKCLSNKMLGPRGRI